MRIVDLTYGISAQMSKYPSDPPPLIETAPATEENRRIRSAVTTLTIRPHHGTHIDAPAHKIQSGKAISQYPVEKFVNRAAFIELTSWHGTQTYARRVTEEMLAETLPQERIRKLKAGGVSALVIRTGYDYHLGSMIAQRTDDPFFPYLTPQAAAYIANTGLPLNILGIDSFSVDPKGSNSEAHRTLFAKDILILETLVNLYALRLQLERCAAQSFTLHSVPMLYHHADAAQTRAYAILDDKN